MLSSHVWGCGSWKHNLNMLGNSPEPQKEKFLDIFWIFCDVKKCIFHADVTQSWNITSLLSILSRMADVFGRSHCSNLNFSFKASFTLTSISPASKCIPPFYITQDTWIATQVLPFPSFITHKASLISLFMASISSQQTDSDSTAT